MEKHYGGETSIRAGLKCFNKMVHHKNDVAMLRTVLSNCQQDLENFREQMEKDKIDYEDKLTPTILESLKGEISGNFASNTLAANYFHRALDPNVDCYYHGGTLSLTFFFGLTASAHGLKCRTKLGRKLAYQVGSGNLGLGWGAIFSFKKARFYRNEDGTYRRKTSPLSFEQLRQSRFYVSDSNAMAVGVGVGHNRRNLEKTTRDERGFGIGIAQGFGFGGIFKDKSIRKLMLRIKIMTSMSCFQFLGWNLSRMDPSS